MRPTQSVWRHMPDLRIPRCILDDRRDMLIKDRLVQREQRVSVRCHPRKYVTTNAALRLGEGKQRHTFANFDLKEGLDRFMMLPIARLRISLTDEGADVVEGDVHGGEAVSRRERLPRFVSVSTDSPAADRQAVADDLSRAPRV